MQIRFLIIQKIIRLIISSPEIKSYEFNRSHHNRSFYLQLLEKTSATVSDDFEIFSFRLGCSVEGSSLQLGEKFIFSSYFSALLPLPSPG